VQVIQSFLRQEIKSAEMVINYYHMRMRQWEERRREALKKLIAEQIKDFNRNS
jgi:hypothetical protein